MAGTRRSSGTVRRDPISDPAQGRNQIVEYVAIVGRADLVIDGDPRAPSSGLRDQTPRLRQVRPVVCGGTGARIGAIRFVAWEVTREQLAGGLSETGSVGVVGQLPVIDGIVDCSPGDWIVERRDLGVELYPCVGRLRLRVQPLGMVEAQIRQRPRRW
jgi:hypothetical protein